MNTTLYFVSQNSRRERRKRLLNKLVDILQHTLVMIAFILFFSFLQMIISS